MNWNSKSRLFGLVLALGPAVACGSGSRATAPEPVASESESGQVGLQLNLPGGVTVTTVNYAITGPTARQGSVAIGNAQEVQFVVGGFTAGSYSIKLTATDSNGDPCSGTGAFSISPGTVSGVSLAMVCFAANDGAVSTPVNTGSVFVDAGITLEAGTPTVCPGITSLTVLPADLVVGTSSTVTIGAVGGTPSVQWTATDATGQTGAGTFAAPTAASTQFTCTHAGQVLVTATVGGAACAGVPFTSMFAVVTCEGEPDAGTDASAAADSSADSSKPDSSPADASDGAVASPCATNNGGAGCSPTEQLFVNHNPTGACYSCLVNGGCLDDTAFGDVNHECGDLAAGSQAACTSVVSCILGSNCASASVSTCYCGTAGVATACQGNPAAGPINGACASQIAAGLGFPVTDGTDNTKQLTNTALAGGMADQIFQCAQSNGCTTCLH